MKPIKIFFFLLYIFLALSLIILFFPDKGIKISDNIHLRFISFNQIFSLPKLEYADISNIIEISESDEHISSKDDSIVIELTDSISIRDSIIKTTDTLKEDIDSEDNIQSIEYPDGDITVLYSFFKSLASDRLIRILHYGDSQIEGDHISSTIREKFQERFGGMGIGMLPASKMYNYPTSIQQKNTGEWIRYSVMSKKKIPENRYFGVLTFFSRYAPLIFDPFDSTTIYQATIEYKSTFMAYSRARKFTQCTMLCGFNQHPVVIEVYIGDKLYSVKTLLSNNKLNVLCWKFNYPVREISFSFTSKDSPDIYAVAFDGKKGVAVDNIPMRGSAGLEFARMNMRFLRKIFKEINVKLILMEFGVNVVPNIVDDYSYYENWFYHQLDLLRRYNPDIPIIVIGLSDMARKTGAGYESYPNIEKIRDAQKQAAFRAGCAFWDLYKAMGGKNSMPSWVFAKPPLANKDFIHFNYRGAKIVGEMFFNAIIREYENYLKKQAT